MRYDVLFLRVGDGWKNIEQQLDMMLKFTKMLRDFGIQFDLPIFVIERKENTYHREGLYTEWKGVKLCFVTRPSIAIEPIVVVVAKMSGPFCVFHEAAHAITDSDFLDKINNELKYFQGVWFPSLRTE